MSKKYIEEVVSSMNDIDPETGLILELIGKTLKSKWQEENGEFYNAETRKDMKNKPLAFVEETDIQIRVGNRLYTVKPAEEGKPVVSIPVGMSDKTTPATIPKDWLMGMLLDGIIVMCEGDTHIALKYVEGINCVIHYDPPDDAKVYKHRSGRTARAGSTGVVISLVKGNEKRSFKKNV